MQKHVRNSPLGSLSMHKTAQLKAKMYRGVILGVKIFQGNLLVGKTCAKMFYWEPKLTKVSSWRQQHMRKCSLWNKNSVLLEPKYAKVCSWRKRTCVDLFSWEPKYMQKYPFGLKNMCRPVILGAKLCQSVLLGAKTCKKMSPLEPKQCQRFLGSKNMPKNISFGARTCVGLLF